MATRSHMRAAVLTSIAAPFEIQDVELLPLGTDRVLVRTLATPFCATDCLNQRGGLGKSPPTILGHAAVGIVEALGTDVRDLSIGQRVVVPGTPECGVCFYCAEGRTDQCSELFDVAFPDSFPDVARLATGEAVTGAGNVGSYAEAMNVSANQVFPVDSPLSDAELSLLGCGILTGVGSVVNIAKVRPGESVAIVGAGHLGLWMTQASRIAGARTIVVIDPIAERRAIAVEVGATHVLDPADGDVVDAVRALTGRRGADVTFEAAGPVAAQREAFLMTRRAGRVVVTGVEDMHAEVRLPQVAFAIGGRDILSSQNGRVRMRHDLPRCIRLLEDGLLRSEPIITRRYDLDGVNEALAAAATHRDLSGVILMGG